MNLKQLLIVLLITTGLNACKQPSEKTTDNGDPVPQTITQQEVSRIALIEAQQHITNAANINKDTSQAQQIYRAAQELYKSGEYKKAQIKAVEVRHHLEQLK